MPLHPQAALAIRVAGDLPVNLAPAELRRAYAEQRVRMLPPAPPVPVVYDVSIPSREGPVAARYYRARDDEIACPLLVFFHGGGWMLGSVDSYDTVCRRLAIRGSCAVLSVDYRLAPETTFPGAVLDAYAATLWAARNAAQLKISPGAIAVGGDSAGGGWGGSGVTTAAGAGTTTSAVRLYSTAIARITSATTSPMPALTVKSDAMPSTGGPDPALETIFARSTSRTWI